MPQTQTIPSQSLSHSIIETTSSFDFSIDTTKNIEPMNNLEISMSNITSSIEKIDDPQPPIQPPQPIDDYWKRMFKIS